MNCGYYITSSNYQDVSTFAGNQPRPDEAGPNNKPSQPDLLIDTIDIVEFRHHANEQVTVVILSFPDRSGCMITEEGPLSALKSDHYPLIEAIEIHRTYIYHSISP